MNYLSLFSGAGGGDLACQHLLEWECLGYVEWDKYCVRIIEQRIKDGVLSDAPIFYCDIRGWIEMYADAYKGMVDVVIAGPPCQGFSKAGKGQGEKDERNMFPATIETIRRVEPLHVLLENVPNILTHKYLGTILGELSQIGYDAWWIPLSHGWCGGETKDERLWIYSTPKSNRRAESLRHNIEDRIETKSRGPGGSFYVQRTRFERLEKRLGEPAIFRTSDGVANRVHRLKAIGNGQVPAVARAAWEILTEE